MKQTKTALLTPRPLTPARLCDVLSGTAPALARYSYHGHTLTASYRSYPSPVRGSNMVTLWDERSAPFVRIFVPDDDGNTTLRDVLRACPHDVIGRVGQIFTACPHLLPESFFTLLRKALARI